MHNYKSSNSEQLNNAMINSYCIYKNNYYTFKENYFSALSTHILILTLFLVPRELYGVKSYGTAQAQHRTCTRVSICSHYNNR